MFLLIGAVAALIVGPLVRPATVPPRDPSTRRRSLGAGRADAESGQRDKDAALAAIREIEFDYGTGKLSTEDYAELRARYEAKAVEAMERQATGGTTPRDDRLEAEIQAARARRRAAHCTSCGTALPAAARFCPACGAAVSEVRR